MFASKTESGALATKTVNIIPGKLQNVAEVIVSSIENFMVETDKLKTVFMIEIPVQKTDS